VNGRQPAAENGADPEVRSYHGQPVLKEPVWTWEIPLYFYTGGLAGTSAGLALGAQIRGNEILARRAWACALTGLVVSPALLTSDLGVPRRFLNMLRMFKVTSPMSVGSWILSASGATTAVAALNAWTGRLAGPARLARPAAAILGLPLSTYTAALIANTAVPAWQEARRELPFVFGSGAAMSAGAAAAMVTPTAKAAPARRLALAGAVLELTSKQLMEQRLGELGEPYRTSEGKRLSGLGMGCICAGGALMARFGGRSRPAAVAAGALLSAGAIGARWSVFKAGFGSAADPKYTVSPQRRRVAAGESAGASRSQPKSGSAGGS
jgi:DMSO reductase anchor subunit